MTPKERYFKKILEQAPIIKCACGCGQEMKAVDNYARSRIYISGHNTPIKYKDPKQYKKEYEKKHKAEKYKWKRQTFRKKKIKLIQMHDSKCALCGIKYNGTNAAIFHFHHKDPFTKKFALGNQLMNKAWSKILEEASKCQMICANCHELQHGEPF